MIVQGMYPAEMSAALPVTVPYTARRKGRGVMRDVRQHSVVQKVTGALTVYSPERMRDGDGGVKTGAFEATIQTLQVGE